MTNQSEQSTVKYANTHIRLKFQPSKEPYSFSAVRHLYRNLILLAVLSTVQQTYQ